ncbi:LysR family transcriptional regulator [Pseudomonas putida S11]|nr:LysR family transcriptional regulator [Pseudomonas putida S11]
MSALDALPDPKLLQLFDVLYQCRSVTRSAEQLGQSQPTVSIWLGRLREELNDPLFVRTPGGMAPTPRADQLIGPCREVLESLRRLTTWEPQFVPATAQRRFRLCVSDASHITLLPSILNHLRTHAPGIRLEAARIDGNTESALESGEADLAIGFVPWLGAGMYQQVLFEQDWVCLSNPLHPRLSNGMSVAGYQAEGHVQISAGTGQKLLEAGLARAGIERRIMLELPAFLGFGDDCRVDRPGGYVATAYRPDTRRHAWFARARLPVCSGWFHGQAALARTVPARQRKSLDQGGGAGLGFKQGPVNTHGETFARRASFPGSIGVRIKQQA